MEIFLLFTFANIVFGFAFIVKEMMTLRIITVISCVMFVAISIFVGLHVPGMMSTLIFSSINIVVNLFHILRLVYLRTHISLPKALKPLHEQFFNSLKPREFMLVISLADKLNAKKNDVIIQQGKPSDLILLTKGIVTIEVDTKKVAVQEKACFLGEFSLVREATATASVIVDQDITYYQWPRQSMETFYNKYPDVFEKLTTLLVLSVMKKMKAQNQQIIDTAKIA